MIYNPYKSYHNMLADKMYDLTTSAAKFLLKYKWLYYILSYTWGILMNLVGLLASLVLIITTQKTSLYAGIWCFKVGRGWGGISLGLMFITDTHSFDRLKGHEFGHTVQNAIFGPLFIFLIAIPSFIRYLHYNRCVKKGKDHSPYDAIWFEGSATEIGTYIESEKE